MLQRGVGTRKKIVGISCETWIKQRQPINSIKQSHAISWYYRRNSSWRNVALEVQATWSLGPWFSLHACHVAVSVPLASVVFMSGLLSPRKEWKKNGEDWQRRRRGCFRTTAYNRCVIVGWRPLVWAEAGRCNAPNKGWQSVWSRL